MIFMAYYVLRAKNALHEELRVFNSRNVAIILRDYKINFKTHLK